ncbi:MAG: mitochondrial fission ELM1 family protein [Pseudomonadota bacterium]
MSSTTPKIWVITDGKIGDDVHCYAVAEALADNFRKVVVNPAELFAAMAPWGPIPPNDRPEHAGSPIAGTPPDIVVASGRRAIPYVRTVQRRSEGNTKVLIMKDPRFGRNSADLIWAPSHDRLSGANVFSTLTSPHGLGAKISSNAVYPNSPITRLPRPRLGIVLGGVSGSVKFGSSDIDRFVQIVENAVQYFASAAVTRSRRTPNRLADAVMRALQKSSIQSVDGSSTVENIYTDILGTSDALLVTGDSHNMVSESLASQAGVYVFRPTGLSKKLSWFLDKLIEDDAIRECNRDMEPFQSAPIDATPAIVAAIKTRLLR